MDAGPGERAIRKRRLHLFSATVLIAAIQLQASCARRLRYTSVVYQTRCRLILLSSLFTYSLLQLRFARSSVCRKS